MRYHLAVISARRPLAAQSLDAPNATWYVGEMEGDEYRRAGAANVVEVGTLCQARNCALDDAFTRGVPCVQLSDDLRSLAWTADGRSAQRISTVEAVDIVLAALRRTRFRLGGVAPTPNAYFYHAPESHNLFCVGDFHVVLPTDLRYDEAMRLKEDYDYCLQHIASYGGLLRVNGILPTFAHRKNPGGAVAYRTPSLEDAMIRHLQAKWGDAIRLNPRRPHEVLLRAKETAAV